jgi:DNA-binding transcriptional LysR family regulator
MGVQAAVASGLGISLLPVDAILPEHQPLNGADGFAQEPASELALIAATRKLEPAVKETADFLIANLTALRRSTKRPIARVN